MSYYNQKRTDRYGRPQLSSRNRGNGRQPRKVYIHPSKFVRSAQMRVEAPYVPENSFADFSLHPLIQNNLVKIGFASPSPIQDKTIPAGLAGSNVVGIANTGTGKTAAFAIPVLQRLLSEASSKAIILAPTRELAQQIEEQCRTIAQGSGLDAALLIGGVPMGPQLRELRYAPRLIVGTPGRIKDHMERRSLELAKCNIVVLDEVDRMLDMGFVNDIHDILSHTSVDRQSFYFSATLDGRVKGIIDGFADNPVHIALKSNDTSDTVEQNVISFSSTGDKISKLHDLLIRGTAIKTIVFDDTHRSVEKLSKELEARGFAVGSIHGGKTQSQRQRVLKSFRNNEISVLVATDVAARGLDVPDITHVINYSVPQTYEDYIHRIGRTGRAGKIGHALTFVEN